MHAAARACRLPECPLQGACVTVMVARALRVHLTRREGAEGGTPLQARPTHSCSTAAAFELRARRWQLAPEGALAAPGGATRGGGTRRLLQRRPRGSPCPAARAATRPEVCARSAPVAARRGAAGRLAAASTGGARQPKRQAHLRRHHTVAPGRCVIDRLYKCYSTQPRNYRRRPRRRLLRP